MRVIPQNSNISKSLFSTCLELNVEPLAQELLSKDGIDMSRIENALCPLKDIGIFEDYPKDRSSWHVGKLFKHSLSMKFTELNKMFCLYERNIFLYVRGENHL